MTAPSVPSLAPVPRTTLPRLKDRQVLGEQGLRVSPFCLGIVDSPQTVLDAYDLGINFFFVTADMHWPLYSALREGLKALFARGPSVRDDVVVAAVSYVTQLEFAHLPFIELIEAVPGLERVDLTVIGGTYANEFYVRVNRYQEHFTDLPGVRAVGASFHDRPAAVMALQHRLIDIAYTRYNPAHPGAEKDLFPKVPALRPLHYNFKSTTDYVSPARCLQLRLPEDAWRPEVTDHYRFVLTRPELDGVLCAFRSPAQVHSLDAALALGPLDEEECTYLRTLARLHRGLAVIP